MTDKAHTPWLEQLRSDGYCIIPRLMSDAIIAWLNADLEDAFEKTPMGKGTHAPFKPGHGHFVVPPQIIYRVARTALARGARTLKNSVH